MQFYSSQVDRAFGFPPACPAVCWLCYRSSPDITDPDCMPAGFQAPYGCPSGACIRGECRLRERERSIDAGQAGALRERRACRPSRSRNKSGLRHHVANLIRVCQARPTLPFGDHAMTFRRPPASRGPQGGQSLAGRRGGRDSDLHGGARYDGGQRLAALHCRRIVGRGDRCRVGDHQLPGRQCHRGAALRLAGRPPRPPQLLPALHRPVHDQFGPLRHGDQSLADHPLPRPAGRGRRRLAAVEPGHPARLLSRRKSRGRR